MWDFSDTGSLRTLPVHREPIVGGTADTHTQKHVNPNNQPCGVYFCPGSGANSLLRFSKMLSGSSDQPLSPRHSLAIIISQPQLKDALGSKFLQSLVHVLPHGIEVLVSLVPQPKDLEGNTHEHREAGGELSPSI